MDIFSFTQEWNLKIIALYEIYRVIQKSGRTLKMNNLKTNKDKKMRFALNGLKKSRGLCGNEKKYSHVSAISKDMRINELYNWEFKKKLFPYELYYTTRLKKMWFWTTESITVEFSTNLSKIQINKRTKIFLIYVWIHITQVLLKTYLLERCFSKELNKLDKYQNKKKKNDLIINIHIFRKVISLIKIHSEVDSGNYCYAQLSVTCKYHLSVFTLTLSVIKWIIHQIWYRFTLRIRLLKNPFCIHIV